MPPSFIARDADQRALAFLLNQATYIEPEVYRTQYPAFIYEQIVPIDESAPEWTKTVTYFSSDRIGEAQWFHAGAFDVPNADVARQVYETAVHMAAIGYEYNLEELNQAMRARVNLTTERASAAREAYEKKCQQVALLGSTTKGVYGLFNHPSVTVVPVADGAGGDSEWETKTAQEMLDDVNSWLILAPAATFGIEMANTLLLPWTSLQVAASRTINELSTVTVLEFIERNNVYTRTTRRPLDIRGLFELETAGAGGVKRAVAYNRDPSVVKMHRPMPFQFLQADKKGPLLYQVPGIFRLGGVDWKRPASARYFDGL